MKNNIYNGTKIDLHLHTRVSDGSDTPEELIGKVKEAGIELFAVTDHDAVKGCGIVQEALKEGDPLFVTGAEFSTRDDLGKYHILGYHYDPQSKAILDLVEKGHSLRMKKVTGRLEFIKSEFGFTFPEEEIQKLLTLDNPGKPHIGNLMVKYGYAESKEVAINEYINKLHYKEEYVKPEEAIEGILGAGGIPVLAHPFFGSGDELILGNDMDERLKRLMGFGLQGVEAFYSGFSNKFINQMLGLSEKYNLYVTAGSDYHGTNKLVILGDTGLLEGMEPPAGLLRFYSAIF
ncbi:MAG: PHP domain-containing protein [Lachnospiraceae bacterium]|nr:PHP domain-containing protein [Lachnospiraceae bacterium]